MSFKVSEERLGLGVEWFRAALTRFAERRGSRRDPAEKT